MPTTSHTRQLVPPTSSVTRSWSLLIAPREDNVRRPIFQMSPSSWFGSGAIGWRMPWPSCIRETRRPSCFQFRTEIIKTCQSLSLKNVTLNQARRPSANASRADSGARTRSSSATRALVSNSRVVRNLRTTCREPSLEPAETLLASASEAPVDPAPLCSQRCRGQSHSSTRGSLKARQDSTAADPFVEAETESQLDNHLCAKEYPSPSLPPSLPPSPLSQEHARCFQSLGRVFPQRPGPEV